MTQPTSLPLDASRRMRSLLALVCTCALWGLSFPVMKALGLHVSTRAPGISTWFVAATTVVVRFGSGALVLAAAGLSRPTALEIKQGLALGVFSGVGMLLQMDALNFSSASTSAFLTQGYVVILPVVAALSTRQVPSAKTISCVLVSATGLAILSGFHWAHLRLGRGETETLLAACSFAVQILCLDRVSYRGNRARVVTIIMFACVACLLLPVSLLTLRAPSDFARLLGAPSSLVLISLLTVPCTVVAFSLMNRYQPEVSASEAGVIYGAEPLFASVLSLFLPQLFASVTGVAYANERLTLRLLVGGGLVVAANVFLQVSWSPRPRRAALSQ